MYRQDPNAELAHAGEEALRAVELFTGKDPPHRHNNFASFTMSWATPNSASTFPRNR